ncbi:hypothetical protein D3C86_2193950 [compost metagenome]
MNSTAVLVSMLPPRDLMSRTPVPTVMPAALVASLVITSLPPSIKVVSVSVSVLFRISVPP